MSIKRRLLRSQPRVDLLGVFYYLYGMKLLVTLFILLQCITGKVVKVQDGDTVTLLTADSTQVRVRLDGVDCPEKKQAFGTKAKAFVSDLCFGGVVTVEDKGKDRYGRVIGVVWVDSINVNEALLRNGLAWHYKQFNNDARLDSLERAARSEKLNIWSQPNPIPPWEFRKGKR